MKFIAGQVLLLCPRKLNGDNRLLVSKSMLVTGLGGQMCWWQVWDVVIVTWIRHEVEFDVSNKTNRSPTSHSDILSTKNDVSNINCHRPMIVSVWLLTNFFSPPISKKIWQNLGGWRVIWWCLLYSEMRLSYLSNSFGNEIYLILSSGSKCFEMETKHLLVELFSWLQNPKTSLRIPQFLLAG